MKIYPIIYPKTTYGNYNSQKNKTVRSNIAFEAMKKSQFSGIDLICIEKFKAPIEKFNKKEDLQNWAKQKLDLILHKDYGGRKTGTVYQRKAILDNWSEFIAQNNTSSTGGLLILTSITRGLTDKSDIIPPILHQATIKEIIERLNKGEDININKAYQAKLQSIFMDCIGTSKKKSRWIQIPSKEQDPRNYEKNVEKLKILSSETWCTHSYQAAKYLKEGDFHIYFVNNKPVIGIRFKDGEIQEVQGIQNNSQIPPEYYKEVKKHIKKYKKTLNVEKALSHAKKAHKIYRKEQAAINKIKKDLSKAIENKSYEEIFDYFDFSLDNKNKNIFSRLNNKIKKIIFKSKNSAQDNAPIKLKCYTQPGGIKKLMQKGLNRRVTFKDLGIDENELFKNVTEIHGNADFFDSNLTSLHNLEKIYGNAEFCGSRFKDIGNLKYIGGNASFNTSSITSLKNLTTIGMDANFADSKITSLGHLKEIGRNAMFNDSLVEDLGELQTIRGCINCQNSPLEKYAIVFWEKYQPN